MFGGATTFNDGTKFAAGQDFDEYIHDFAGDVMFDVNTDFKEGQDFDGAVEFLGLFDYDDMFGKALFCISPFAHHH